MDEDGTELKVKDFVESRYREMRTMLELSSRVSGNNAPQQQLPRHMRRRAASHNVKRLPLALREKYMKEQLKSGPPVSSKRPSRKHRRRPKNLFSEYARRSRKVRWMETHIWHARRFHMGNLWSCKIPLFRNDRGVRAAYRDSKNECLIADLSWMHCIEVVGDEESIIEHLSVYTDRNSGSLLTNNDFIEGRKEGRVMFYLKEGYPHKPICVVNFLWKSLLYPKDTSTNRHLLLWVHPASFHLLLHIIVSDLSLKSVEEKEREIEKGKAGEGKEEEGKEEEGKEEKGKEEKGAKKTYVGAKIKIIDRTNDFSRFHLIGPKSLSILLTVLQFNLPDNDEMKHLYGYNDMERSIVESQQRYWKETELLSYTTPSHSIVPLHVADPRLNMPRKKLTPQVETLLNHSSMNLQLNTPPHPFSPIWESDKMAALKRKTLSTHQFNQLKGGSAFSEYDISVPLLLLHQPDPQTPGNHGGGWDVVFPSGWAMPFWLAFNYQGARSIGLKELEHISFETHHLSFPAFFPDTQAGQEHHLNEFKALKTKYDKMPASKRCNFQKYNVPSPFHFPFQQLCDVWLKMYNEENSNHAHHPESFFVIRDLKFLRQLKDTFEETRKRTSASSESEIKSIKCVVRVKNSCRVYASVTEGERLKRMPMSVCAPLTSYLTSKEASYAAGLVAVHLAMEGRGAPSKFSIIYLPCQQDLDNILHKQPLQQEDRKKFPRLKKTQKKLAKSNKKSAGVADDVPLTPPVLDEKEVTFSSTPERLVVGYVVHGGFSYALSKGSALGFVSLPGLLKTRSVCQAFRTNNLSVFPTLKNVLLVRDTKSLHCRYATCSVLTHVI